MQVLFEADKKLSYRNRFLRGFFVNVTVVGGAVMFFMWLTNSHQHNNRIAVTVVCIIGYTIFYTISAIKRAKLYITRVAAIDDKLIIEYLDKDQLHTVECGIDTQTFYDNSNFTMSNLTFELPQGTINQYMIGRWNEDSMLDLLEDIGKLKVSVDKN